MCLAIPGQILELTNEERLTRSARVSFGGIIKDISLVYTPEAKVDDFVLVHVGFAISTIDEEEAHKVFEYIKQMGEMDELQTG